jgi:hypothetical protein
MRKLVYTNPDGDSITFDEGGGYFGITSLEGLGVPTLSLQSQKAPYQHGTTPIDRLVEPREIVVEGVICAGQNQPIRYQQMRILTKALNKDIGVGTLVYTNDIKSYQISCTPEGPVFSNKNADEGNQKFHIVFYCDNPYWTDTTNTVVTVSSSDLSATAVNITGDSPVSIHAEITGSMNKPVLTEQIQNQFLSYADQVGTKLVLDTGFGNKTAYLQSVGEYTTANTGYRIRTCAYSPDQYMWCAVGSSGTILTSTNGTTWISQTIGAIAHLYGVSYSTTLAQWCAVGSPGTILTSTNGTTWISQTSGVIASLGGVSYSTTLAQWCAVGSSGTILTSTNGTTWISQTSGVIAHLWGVSYSTTLAQWCAVGDSGTILVSSGANTKVNVIQNLTPDSTFFQLRTGNNNLKLSVTNGHATAAVSYKNNYIGV